MKRRELLKRLLVRSVPSSLYFSINAVVASRDIAKGKRWEPELQVLTRFVCAGETVLDIGGNHGLYTYHLSRLVGDTGRVHTFEPLPPNLRILSNTVKRLRLSNVTIHEMACGTEAGTATFCIPLAHGVPQLGWAHQGGEGATFECKVVRLDETIHSPVSFIKCDIEGAELFALRGAERILRDNRPVLLLEADNHTSRFGYLQQDVFDYLSEFGYNIYSASLERRLQFTDRGNYWFVPQDFEL